MKKLIMTELAIIFIISLVLKNFMHSVAFTIFFTFLFFIPILPWIIKLKTGNLEKIVLTNVIGLALIPTLYIFIGSIMKLNIIIYILIPLIILILGLYKDKYLKKK
ncbi:hypothetical protein HN865_04075 [Candidatus Woesearchaeota archaeon]|jgi:hypothetical protein|nr:hypothetical protein [Candidatus Woesearchaeota archaeon]